MYFLLMVVAFRAYSHKVKELKFEQKPDYQALSVLFRDLYYKKESFAEMAFCWIRRYVCISIYLK